MNTISLSQILSVLTFGILGVGSRFAIDQWTLRQEQWVAPQSTALATLSINMVGCALAAFIFQLSASRAIISNELKMGILVGFCGGFTTFSGFGLQVLQLWNLGNFLWVVVYTLATPVLCLLGTITGVFVAKLF